MVEDLRENEKILFELSGYRMQGRYALIKTKFGGEKDNRNWLFFKRYILYVDNLILVGFFM